MFINFIINFDTKFNEKNRDLKIKNQLDLENNSLTRENFFT